MSGLRQIATALATAALLLVTACDAWFAPKSPFKGVDVTGSTIGGEMRLADHNGNARSLADFRGKVVVVLFGYTHCPDVCPTTLADLSAAVKRLGADAPRVQVLFVTVDPKRDTPELLRQYVPAFNADFLGLSGDAETTVRVTRDFHVYAQERPGKSADTYTVDHSAQTFVFDREGRIRLVLAYGSTPEDIASDLRILLRS